METCSCLHTLAGHNKPVQKLAISNCYLYSIAGRKIRVWDLDTFACLRNIHTQDDGGALRALSVTGHAIHVAGQVRYLAHIALQCDCFCQQQPLFPAAQSLVNVTTSAPLHCSLLFFRGQGSVIHEVYLSWWS